MQQVESFSDKRRTDDNTEHPKEPSVVTKKANKDNHSKHRNQHTKPKKKLCHNYFFYILR